jgi:cobalt-zinc-cadmium efflux system outer membrane protein
MKMRIIKLTIFLILIGAISGCASVYTKEELNDVQGKIEKRTQKKLDWEFGSKNEDNIQQKIQNALQNNLTVDTAVEIALINNPSLQADFEELEIVKADLVQFGLLKNPSFEGSFRKPSHDGETNTEFEVTQDILSLLTLPLRKGLVNTQLEQAKYAVGEAVMHLDSEVRNAYYSLQAAKQKYAMQQKILKAEEAAVELVQRQFEAGNVSDLVLMGQQIAFNRVQLDIRQSEAEVNDAKELLGRLMGVSSRDMSWDIEDSLPYLSKNEPSLEILETKALSQNFDLLMAKKEVQAMKKALNVSRVNVLPEIHAGFNTEKEPDGGRLEGPMFEVEVPLFDQKQTSVARSKAQLRQSEQRLRVKENEVCSELRSKFNRLLATRSMVEKHFETVLPLQTKFTDSLQKHYNFMLVGVYDLLNAKKDEIDSYQNFVESLKEYWILRSELELLAGEKIEYIPAETPSMETKPKSAQHENHHNHGGK